jgi:predicted ATPase
MQISKKRSNPTTLLIEQPELHLHPAMQANLADLFVDAVSNNSKMQIIAETHSESMLLRIQKRLRDGKISPELVQILYVDKGINGNQVSELTLNSEDEFSISMPVSFSQLRLRDLL